MKKTISLLLALLLVLSLAACGGTTTTTPPAVLDPTTVPEAPVTPADPTAPETPAEDVWEGDYETATFADVRKYGIGSTKWDGSLPLSTTGEKLELGVLASSTRMTPFMRCRSVMARPTWSAGSSRRKSYQGSSRMLSACIRPWRTAR